MVTRHYLKSYIIAKPIRWAFVAQIVNLVFISLVSLVHWPLINIPGSWRYRWCRRWPVQPTAVPACRCVRHRCRRDQLQQHRYNIPNRHYFTSSTWLGTSFSTELQEYVSFVGNHFYYLKLNILLHIDNTNYFHNLSLFLFKATQRSLDTYYSWIDYTIRMVLC